MMFRPTLPARQTSGGNSRDCIVSSALLLLLTNTGAVLGPSSKLSSSCSKVSRSAGSRSASDRMG